MKVLDLREWLKGDMLDILTINSSQRDKVVSILKEAESEGLFEKKGKRWLVTNDEDGIIQVYVTNDVKLSAYTEVI